MSDGNGYKPKIEDMPRFNGFLAEKMADPEFASAYEEAKHETAFAIALTEILEKLAPNSSVIDTVQD